MAHAELVIFGGILGHFPIAYIKQPVGEPGGILQGNKDNCQISFWKTVQSKQHHTKKHCSASFQTAIALYGLIHISSVWMECFFVFVLT